MCTCTSNYFKGTKILLGELFGRTGSAEELSFDIDLLSYLEVRQRLAVCIGGALVALLSLQNDVAEVVMKFSEVYSEVSCVAGC